MVEWTLGGLDILWMQRPNINSNNSYYKAWPMKWSNFRDSVMNSVCEILDQGGHGELINT